MNIHLIQPYGLVFEIRVHEGYGARWTHDGSKVGIFSLQYCKGSYSTYQTSEVVSQLSSLVAISSLNSFLWVVFMQFIGFLEPYMAEGFSKGWKH
jgi:hypothetical protein